MLGIVHAFRRGGRLPHFLNSQSGQATVEFAVVFPIILFVTLAIMQLSFIYIAKNVTAYAAFCAARAHLVGKDPERAAAMVCSAVAVGRQNISEFEDEIAVPGWGVLTRSDIAQAKTFVEILEDAGDNQGDVRARVTLHYQLIFPLLGLENVIADEALTKQYGGAPHIAVVEEARIWKQWKTPSFDDTHPLLSLGTAE